MTELPGLPKVIDLLVVLLNCDDLKLPCRVVVWPINVECDWLLI